MTFLDYIKEVLEELEQDKEKTLDEYIAELPEDELITLFECYIKTCAGKGDYEKYIGFIKSLLSFEPTSEVEAETRETPKYKEDINATRRASREYDDQKFIQD